MSALQVFDPAAGELVRCVDAAALLAAGGIPDPAEADTTVLAAFDENSRTLDDEALGDEVEAIVCRRPAPRYAVPSAFSARILDGERFAVGALRLGEAAGAVDAVQTAGVNRLVKGGGEVADTVRWCRVALTPPRRVAKVKRAIA